MWPLFMWPLTKDKSIIIGNRYQIDFSPDLPTARFPGNFRLFSGHRVSILMPSPLSAAAALSDFSTSRSYDNIRRQKKHPALWVTEHLFSKVPSAPPDARRFYPEGAPPPCVMQNDFSVINRRVEENGVTEASSPVHENVGFMAYNVLAGGVLTGGDAKP